MACSASAWWGRRRCGTSGTALLPGLSGGAAGLASLALAGLLLFDSNWYFLLLEHYRDVHIWHVTPHPDLMQTEMERKNM